MFVDSFYYVCFVLSAPVKHDMHPACLSFTDLGNVDMT
jgi:hypothetical protein